MFEAHTRKPSYEASSYYCDEMDIMVASKAMQCGICDQRFRAEDFSHICSCQHQFCKDCLKYYVLHKVRNQFALIECPKQGCKEIIQKSCATFQELPKNLQQRYERIEVNLKSLANTTGKLCPDCSTHLSEVKNQPNLFCTKCVKKFCKLCLSPPHPTHLSCERQVQRFLKFNFQYKRCARCKFIVERTEGCNHMTCTCKYEFCYNCGGKWESSYHECPPKPKYVRPRSYHVKKRQIPVRQVYAINITNMSFNPEELQVLPLRSRRMMDAKIALQNFSNILKGSLSNSRNKENENISQNRSSLVAPKNRKLK